MAGAAADVVWVDVLPSMRRFGPELERGTAGAANSAGQTAGNNFTNSFKRYLKIGAVIGTAMAAGAGIAFMKEAVTEASNLGESLNAVAVTYGDNAKGIETLGKQAAQAVGLSQSQFNGLAVQFSAFASTIAGEGGDVVGTIDDLTTRGADFASVMNLDVNQAMGLFQSGLAGESEPLRKFGIDMSAAAVEAYAYANGIAAAGEPLTEQQKVQARYASLMEQTAKVQGDFTNTSDSLANSQRILGARWDDIQAKVGAKVIPVLERLSGWVLDKGLPLLDQLGAGARQAFDILFRGDYKGGPLGEEDSSFIDKLFDIREGFLRLVGVGRDVVAFLWRNREVLLAVGVAIATVAAGIKIYNTVVKVITAVTRAWAVVQAILNGTLLLNPIGLVVVALVALVAALVFAYRNSETFRNIVQAAWKGIQEGVKFAWENVIKPALEALHGFIVNTLAPAALWLWRNVLLPAFEGIWAAVKRAWDFIRPVLELWAHIMLVVVPAALWGLWNNAVKPVFEWIAGHVKRIWNEDVKPILSALGDFITTHVAPVFRKGVDLIGQHWSALMELARKPVNFVIDTVYNNGIRTGFNKVAEILGSDARLPAMGLIGAVAGASRGPARGVQALARGGYAPPGMKLVGEEGPELVDFKTPGRVYTASQTRRMLGTGDLMDGIRGGIRKGTDVVKGAASILADPAGWIKRQVEGLISQVPGSTFGQVIKAVPQKLLGLAADKLGTFFSGDDGAGVGSTPGGGRGWQWQMATLRSRFPGLRLNSGYRPGAVTALGNPSMHGIGRAVDVPPSMEVFNWIRQNYGAQTKQLIFSPAGPRQIINGRSTNIGGVTRAMHWDHVHWGYDQGGVLPPGVRQVANLTGKPEAILNPQQWADISKLAARGAEASSRLPETVVLEVDGRQFTAFVREESAAGARHGRRMYQGAST